MLLDGLLNHLDKVSQRGDQYAALCPAHDDKNPSLSITEKDGKILLNCWAGCTCDEIIDALGLKLSDLFTDSGMNDQQSQVYAKNKTAMQHLEMLEIEIHIFYQCIVQLVHTDIPLSDKERARNFLAQTRILKLIGLLNDARRI